MPSNNDKTLRPKPRPTKAEDEHEEDRLDALIPAKSKSAAQSGTANKSTLPSKMDKSRKESMLSKLDGVNKEVTASRLDKSSKKAEIPQIERPTEIYLFSSGTPH